MFFVKIDELEHVFESKKKLVLLTTFTTSACPNAPPFIWDTKTLLSETKTIRISVIQLVKILKISNEKFITSRKMSKMMIVN